MYVYSCPTIPDGILRATYTDGAVVDADIQRGDLLAHPERLVKVTLSPRTALELERSLLAEMQHAAA